MNSPVKDIIFVTERPLMVVGFRELLHWAGLGAEHSIIGPAELQHSVDRNEASLIVIDSECRQGWGELAELRKYSPKSVLVLWCSRVTPQFVQAAMEAGLHGLLSTRIPVEEAATMLRQICQGERKFRFDTDLQAQTPPEPRLTRREQQVLAMVVDGLKNREIAAALRTTEGSVKVYLNRVFRKTGVKNRYELAVVARGLVKGRPEDAPQSSRLHTAGAFDSAWMFTDGLDAATRGR